MKKLLLIFSLIFLGCSNKNIFIPKSSKEKFLKYKYDKRLVDYTEHSITLEDNGKFYDENNKNLGKFIKINKDLAKNGSKLLLIKEKKVIKLPELIACATKQKNLIAIVFENNSEGIYDLSKNRLIFYKENNPSLAVKYLKADPLFYQDLVFFPLLNSKVSIYDLKSNQFLRNIDLDDENLITNIVFLKIVNNNLIMATPHKIMVFNPNFLIDYKGDIKHIIDLDNFLYVFKVDGGVIKLDTNLKKIKEIKLPFADFFAPSICNGKIYTISDNYLIEIDKNLDAEVFSGNKFDISEPLRIKGCKIYNSNKVYFIE